jgi:hypothetical protein
MTYMEFLTASKLTDTINLDLISLPKELHNPEFAFDLKENPKALTKQILDSFFVGGQYLFDVVNVTVSKFNPLTKEAEYTLSLKEDADGEKIEREIEYPVRFSETYAERKLMKIGEADIKINSDLMSKFPPDELDDQLFICDHLFTILGIEYIIPELSAKEADVTIKIGAGDKSIYIVKNLEFEISREEHQMQL